MICAHSFQLRADRDYYRLRSMQGRADTVTMIEIRLQLGRGMNFDILPQSGRTVYITVM